MGTEKRGAPRHRVADPLVHVDHVDLAVAGQAGEPARRDNIELVAERESNMLDPALGAALGHLAVGPRDRQHRVPARRESGCGLEHLRHRAGGEVDLLEHLDDGEGFHRAGL